MNKNRILRRVFAEDKVARHHCSGWIGYFRYANIKTRLIGLDRLPGSRLRYCIWKSWKRIRTRIRNLMKLGLPEWLAVKWGLTRRGGWHVVQSPILQTTLTNERLQKRGFLPTENIYKRVSDVKRTAVYRPVCTVV